MPGLSPQLEQTLHRALDEARVRRHEYATLEHLLLSLIDDTDAVAVLRACNVDLEELRDDLIAYLDHELGALITDSEDEVKPTAGFQRVIQRAIIHVQSSGREDVTGANVLIALFSERESHAVYFLHEQEMTRLDAVSYVSHGIAKTPGMNEDRIIHGAMGDEEDDLKLGADALEAYCVNLNEKAEAGRIDPLIGREAADHRCQTQRLRSTKLSTRPRENARR